MAVCRNCDGSGKIECPHCAGSGYEPSGTDMSAAGWVEAAVDAARSVVFGPEECHVCHGNKEIDCPDCGGTGEV